MTAAVNCPLVRHTETVTIVLIALTRKIEGRNILKCKKTGEKRWERIRKGMWEAGSFKQKKVVSEVLLVCQICCYQRIIS